MTSLVSLPRYLTLGTPELIAYVSTLRLVRASKLNDAMVCLDCWRLVTDMTVESEYRRESHSRHKVTKAFKSMQEPTEQELISLAR